MAGVGALTLFPLGTKFQVVLPTVLGTHSFPW